MIDEPLDVLASVRVLPLVSVPDPTVATQLADTLVSSGLPVIEIALRTDGALDAVRAIVRTGRALVGAGTVVNSDQAAEAVDAGARFVVTPGFDPGVIRVCGESMTPVIPGVATATEVLAALNHGIRILKLFPASVIGGLALIDALRGPFPDVRFVPTGGITAESAPSYLAHPSVLAVGGSWMVPHDAVVDRKYGAVSALAQTAAELGHRPPGHVAVSRATVGTA